MYREFGGKANQVVPVAMYPTEAHLVPLPPRQEQNSLQFAAPDAVLKITPAGDVDDEYAGYFDKGQMPESNPRKPLLVSENSPSLAHAMPLFTDVVIPSTLTNPPFIDWSCSQLLWSHSHQMRSGRRQTVTRPSGSACWKRLLAGRV